MPKKNLLDCKDSNMSKGEDELRVGVSLCWDAQAQTDGAVSSCKSSEKLSRKSVHREHTRVKTKGTRDTCGDVLLTFTTSFSKGLPITLRQH